MDKPNYTLSVVIPCHNAKDMIQPLAARMHACPVPHIEIIAVDDASTDGTREMLEGELSGLIHRAVYLSRQSGKAAAVAAAAALATGKYVVVQNAVLEFDPVDYPLLLQPLLEGTADGVFARGAKGSKKANRLVRGTLGLNLSDISGSAKAFRLSALRALGTGEDLGNFSVHAAAVLFQKGYRVTGANLPRRQAPNQAKESPLDSMRTALLAVKQAKEEPST